MSQVASGGRGTLRSPATSPKARANHALAYDLARRRVVLFGGDATGETWEWDGTDWTQRSPATSPGARLDPALVYDLARKRVVLFGGSPATETWEWDGTDWTRRALTTDPGARQRAAMAYDPARQRVVLFGGGPGPLVLGGTWLLGSAARAAAETLGSACAGANGPPVLTSNEPYLGNPAFRFQVHGARAASACLLALATAPENLALGGGCTLYVKPPLFPSVAVTDGSGFANGPPMAMPFDLSLRGVTVWAQAFVADPQGPVAGLTLSAGRRLLLGD